MIKSKKVSEYLSLWTHSAPLQNISFGFNQSMKEQRAANMGSTWWVVLGDHTLPMSTSMATFPV